MIWMIHLVTTQLSQYYWLYSPCVLYTTSLWLTYFKTRSSYHLIPLPYFTHSLHLLPSGSQCLFPLCMSLLHFFVCLFHLFIFFSTQWIFFHFFKIEVHFFPEWAVQACIPMNSVRVFPFLNILTNICCFLHCSF